MKDRLYNLIIIVAALGLFSIIAMIVYGSLKNLYLESRRMEMNKDNEKFHSESIRNNK